MLRRLVSIVASFSLSVVVLAAPAGAAELPDLEGSYRLVERVLPDGTVQTPPQVVGFMTYAGGHRNFNVAWDDAEGKRVTLSIIATYELSDAGYCEDVEHWVANNLTAPGVSLTPPAEKGECGKVEVVDGRTRIHYSGEPVYVVATDKGFDAIAEGMFVDHWQRVE